MDLTITKLPSETSGNFFPTPLLENQDREVKTYSPPFRAPGPLAQWLEHASYKREVGGSNPPGPTKVEIV